MRIGLMIGPERGRYRTKVERLQADARWAEEAGLATVWIPQIPDEFDALTAATLVGADTSRIEIGTAVVPVQPRHPIALAQQVLSVQAVCEGRSGRRPRCLAPLGHRRDARPALRASGADHAGLSRRPGPGAGRARHRRRGERVLPRAQPDRHHRHRAHPGPARRARAAACCELCGERADGTILWMADERAIGSYVVPNLTRAAEAAGRPAPGSWPAFRCASVPTTRSRSPWPGPTGSCPRRRCRPTTRSCSSTATPGPSATSWWRGASRRSGNGCRPWPMPA